MRKIDGKSRTVRELLSGAKYGIDFYQREYRWEPKQIQELMDDLTGKFLDDYDPAHERAAVEKYGHYFLGSIVLSHKNNQNFIIDGQQRLTSLTLLLIFLNNRQKGATEPVEIADLIFSTKYGKRSFNLDVPERNASMEALFTGQPYDATEAPASVRTIMARYADIEEMFPEEATGPALPYFIDWLLENVHLIEITAYSDEDAYTIFETMNDRGLSLSLPDMLKGYLLSSITDGDAQGTCNDMWKSRILRLSELGKDEEVDFFKTWLRAQYADTIRERKKSATNQAFERIGTEFHRWLRDCREQVGLTKSQDFIDFIQRDFTFFARQYERVRGAATKRESGLDAIYYNAHRGYTLQHQLLLAPLQVGDSPPVVETKLRLVADFVDIVLARRVWNFRSIAYSTTMYWAFLVMREIRGLDVPALSAVLLDRLKAEPAFANNERLRRHQQNQYQVHHLLARMSYWVEQEAGVASTFEQFVQRDVKKPYEIEHLWADKFERFMDEFKHPADFAERRDHIGGLVLLPRGFNQSLGGKTYEEKLPHYNAQNVLARSLNPACYENNPSFLAFLERTQLPFKAHPQFKKADQDERQKLYGLIAEQVWSPRRLEVAP
jgi:hypothetical protein